MNKYIFYHDPGHAWLRVPKKEIIFCKDKISPFSYEKGKYVYLEEDCDVDTFLTCKFGSIQNAKLLCEFKNKFSKTASSIRKFKHYYQDCIESFILV